MSTKPLALPGSDLRALVTGEVIMVFLPKGTVTVGDACVLTNAGPRAAEDLKPAYRRWAEATTPDGPWHATVETVAAADTLDAEAGQSRHILAEVGQGDLVVLRVRSDRGPVLSDEAFTARRASLESALRS